MGKMPMSGGLIQTRGQDARATADIQKLAGSSAGFQPALPSIGRGALLVQLAQFWFVCAGKWLYSAEIVGAREPIPLKERHNEL